MLNKNGERELCYVVKVDDIQPIQGRDKVECAVIGGWTCMVRKGQFNKGDLGIYFEIDSKVDTSKEVFKFTEKYNGKIKTQKFSIKDENGNKVGQFWSQGLLMSAEDFGWELIHIEGGKSFIARPSKEDKRITSTIDNLYEGDFLTKELGVTYAEVEDNKRKFNKQNKDAKYQRMMNRNPKLAKSKFGRWCMKYSLTKKILYFILGGDKKNGIRKFPEHINITDEERYQNLSQELYDSYCKEPFIMTEKIDGSSGTFAMKGRGKNRQYWVCSRTVVKDIKDPKGGYYDENIWAEVNEKYNLQNVCSQIIDEDATLDFVTIQGEVFGKKVQKREYGLSDRDLRVFNVIFGYTDGTQKRLNPIDGKVFMKKYNIPFVPVLGEIMLPSDRNELQNICSGKSLIDGKEREGIVFRSLDGKKSFKAVDNEFLVKYHG